MLSTKQVVICEKIIALIKKYAIYSASLRVHIIGIATGQRRIFCDNNGERFNSCLLGVAMKRHNRQTNQLCSISCPFTTNFTQQLTVLNDDYTNMPNSYYVHL